MCRVRCEIQLAGRFTISSILGLLALIAYAGILEREQEQSVVYGSIDFGKTVVAHDKYKELVG
jgi:hypothetical protein